MNRVEELQGMTHEDLVRLVQDLESENTELHNGLLEAKQESDKHLKWYTDECEKYRNMRSSFITLAKLVD